jgi:hypothetical protein
MSIHNQPDMPHMNPQQPIAARGQLRRTKDQIYPSSRNTEENISSLAQSVISKSSQLQAPNKRGPHPDVLLRRESVISKSPQLQAPNKRGPHPDVLLRKESVISKSPQLQAPNKRGPHPDVLLRGKAASTNAEDLERSSADNPVRSDAAPIAETDAQYLERFYSNNPIMAPVAPIAETIRQREVVSQLGQSILQPNVPPEQKSPSRPVKPKTPNHYDSVDVPLNDPPKDKVPNEKQAPKSNVQYSPLPGVVSQASETIMSREEKLEYNQLSALARKGLLKDALTRKYNELQIKYNRLYENESNLREGAKRLGNGLPPPRETLE